MYFFIENDINLEGMVGVKCYELNVCFRSPQTPVLMS